MKTIRIAQDNDWRHFLALAGQEGWRVPALETELFQGAWRPYVWALLAGQEFCGLLTAVPHQRSGWIGNLIVPAALRGRGHGTELFVAALNVLEDHGMASVWLTASPLGQPIYAGFGFDVVGAIERWVLPAGRKSVPTTGMVSGDEQPLRAADAGAWGESRRALLDALLTRGQVVCCDQTVALLQQHDGLQILGPWYSPGHCPRANRVVLQQALELTDSGQEVVVDLLATSPQKQLLAAAGFRRAGQNSLMARGEVERSVLEQMVSLASLGSIG